jgi:hypothetical protein
MRIITPPPGQYGINLRSESDAPRSPGIHLSGIIRRIAITRGLLKSFEDDEDLDVIIGRTHPDLVGENSRLLLVAWGVAWEEYRARRMGPGFIHQPGEISHDGISMTPDGLEFLPDGSILLHEFKATWTSARKPLEEHPMWMWQGAGYLKALSEQYQQPLTRVMFHPLFMRGDYSRTGPQWPLYRPEIVEFEPEEIQSYWTMIVRNRDYAIPEKGI